jgi:repressor LexA
MISHLSPKALSPIQVETVKVPLVGYAPCGGPLVAPENMQGEIEVQKSKLRLGAKYFVIQAVGDSMNLAGIQDGDLLLCRAAEKADTGDRVVAILEGEKVTVKVYGPRENGVRLLLPKSTNTIHRPITPAEGDSVQGIVQEVLPEMD